jgi:hypothetical protein
MKLKLTETTEGRNNLNGFVDMVASFTKDKTDEIFDLAFQVYGSYVESTFEREGPGWDSLARRTLRERADLGFPSSPILQRTGILKQTLTDPTMGNKNYSVGDDSFATGNELVIRIADNRASIQFGTLDKRFEVLQSGETNEWFNIPARPMVPEGEEQNDVLGQIDTAMGALFEPPRPNGDWK